MTPAFGFSVGDFISTLELIRKISKALQETGGASSQYQHVVLELNALQSILLVLERLEPTHENAGHVNAIRGMALACQLPLREFIVKLDKYEKSLGPFSTQRSFLAAGRKSQWTLYMHPEVEKLRTCVSAKVITINLVLQTQALQVSQIREAQRQNDHAQTMSGLREQKEDLTNIKSHTEEGQMQARRYHDTTINELAAIRSNTDSTQAGLMSLRGYGEQVRQFIGTFPGEVRTLLGRIIRSNFDIYNVLLALQQHIAATPSTMLESNITMSDALNRVHQLQYKPFCDWEMFDAYVRHKFKDLPGEANITVGKYLISDNRSKKLCVGKDQWSQTFLPGAKLSMAVVLTELRGKPNRCPRDEEHRLSTSRSGENVISSCVDCDLNFWSSQSELGNMLDRFDLVDESESVATRQVLEDVQSFGARFPPTDAAEIVGEPTKGQPAIARARMESIDFLGNQKGSWRHEAWKDESSDIALPEEILGQGHNQTAITAMDWNSAPDPLDAWLNQSAVPSLDNRAQEILNEAQRTQAVLERERQDLEHLRNVYLHAQDTPSSARSLKHVADETMDPAAWAHHRRIMDKFPDIPVFLSRRLADANTARESRLRTLCEPCLSNEHGEDERFESSSYPQDHTQDDPVFDSDAKAQLTSRQASVGVAGKTRTNSRSIDLAARKKRQKLNEHTHQDHQLIELQQRTEESVPAVAQDRCYGQNLDEVSGTWSRKDDGPYDVDCDDQKNCNEHFPSAAWQQNTQDVFLGQMQYAPIHLYPQQAQQTVTRFSTNLSPGRASMFAVHDNLRAAIQGHLPHFAEMAAIPCEPPTPSPAILDECIKANRSQNFWSSESFRDLLKCQQRQLHNSELKRQRSSSVCSYTSSHNSSLRGESEMDLGYQTPTFSGKRANSNTSYEIEFASPSLPPPPLQLVNQKEATCDLCGKTVTLRRKRDWQRHVIQDLEPYVCPVESCESANDTYRSYSRWYKHLQTSHLGFNATVEEAHCVFCGLECAHVTTESLKHLSKHMEDIAFSVVPRAYEDWAFYSDSDSNPDVSVAVQSLQRHNLDDQDVIILDYIARYIEGPDQTDSKWICKIENCNKRFGRKENIKSHVQTHLNDRQFKCEVCNKGFVRNHDLRRHKKIHTGTKPYPCLCGNSFARHDALIRHKQRGMCIGASGIMRKAVKRGRPRQNRHERANERYGQYTSSVSSCSFSSFDLPPG